MISLLLALAMSASAADVFAVVEPRKYDNKPGEYRMIMYDVPPGMRARFVVALTKDGACFDTSFLNQAKKTAQGKTIHTLQFDAWLAPVNGTKPAGCARRAEKSRDGIAGGLHVVDIPAEKHGSKVFVTYRAGTEVRVALNPKS
jgi:hypothetical protein